MLLILTDGTIHDFDATKQVIVELSQHPCSIIIIGLGDEDDFEEMYQLDGDGENKLPGVSRDIV